MSSLSFREATFFTSALSERLVSITFLFLLATHLPAFFREKIMVEY